MRSTGYFLNYLTISVVIISFFLLPHFYNYRLATGIFRNDFYIIWLTGCFCWLSYLLYSQIHFTTIGKICASGCVYVLFSFFLNSSLDESSFYAFITLLSIVGIVLYLKAVSLTRLFSFGLAAIFIAYSIQILIGLSQAIENDWQNLGIKGQLHNSGFYGNYLASMIPLLFSALLNKKGFSGLFRLSVLIFFLLAFFLLFSTLARAAIIGSFMGVLTVLLFKVKWKRSRRFMAYAMIVLLIPLMAATFYSLKPASASGRLTIYKVSLYIFKDHPLFGIGPNRFAAVYNNYQSAYFSTANHTVLKQLLAENTLEAFNSLLQILVEYGIIGLAILCVFTYQLIVSHRKHDFVQTKNWLRAGCTGCIFSIIVCSLFSNPFHVTPILMILAYHLAVIIPNQNKLNGSQLKLGFPLLIYGAFVLLIGYYTITHLKAERAWMKASDAAKFDTFSIARPYYDEAMPTMQFNGDFLFNYGAEASIAGEYKLAADLLENAKKYNSYSNLFVFLGDAYLGLNRFALAEKNYLHAIYIAPSHIYPKYQLVQLYKKWNKPNLAKVWATKTVAFPVKIKSESTDELLSELRLDIQK